MTKISKNVAIVGIAETGIGKSYKTCDQLYAEASRIAIEDAGLTKDDVDGIITAYCFEEPYFMHSTRLAEYLGLNKLRFNNHLAVGGATPATLVGIAAMAITNGLCNTVLVASAGNRASGMGRDRIIENLAEIGHPQFENPFGPMIPALYAMFTQRHMYEFGTQPEQLAAISVAQRNHAALKHNAVMKEPITINDVLSSPMIASPLHRLDCCLLTDFGGAMVLTTAERARDLKQPIVFVMGIGEGHTHEYISQAPSLTTSGARLSGERAFQMAALTPTDIDVVELYDCFSITPLIELEDLGFCAKGEGGAFVQDGRIELGGELPMNTNGGMLSFSTGGIFHIIEAVIQLRGHAGQRQVDNARFALAHNNGGIFSTHCTVILGNDNG